MSLCMKFFKYVLVFVFLFPFSVFAITPSSATVSSLEEFQDISISSVSNAVLYVVDVNENKGIANQNPDTPSFLLWTNGTTGWNSPCSNYANLGLVPIETCSTYTNTDFPTVQEGFHVRVYDTSTASCYGGAGWSDPETECSGETYLDITFAGVAGDDAVNSTTTPSIVYDVSEVLFNGIVLWLLVFFGVVYYFRRFK